MRQFVGQNVEKIQWSKQLKIKKILSFAQTFGGECKADFCQPKCGIGLFQVNATKSENARKAVKIMVFLEPKYLNVSIITDSQRREI